MKGEDGVGPPDQKGAGTTYVVVHVAASGDHGADVVSPVRLDYPGAVVGSGCAVPNLPVIGEDFGACDPLVGRFGPVSVGLITSVPSKAGCQLEESSCGDCVLIIVSSVEGEDLPSKSSVADGGVPSPDLFIEDCLGKAEPRWRAWRRVGEVEFGGIHSGIRPKDLIIISLCFDESMYNGIRRRSYQ